MNALLFIFGWSAFLKATAALSFALVGYIQLFKFFHRKKFVSVNFSRLHYLLGFSFSLLIVLMAFNVEAYEKKTEYFIADPELDDIFVVPTSIWEKKIEDIPPPPEPDKQEIPVVKPIINPIILPVDLEPIENEEQKVEAIDKVPVFNADSMMLVTKEAQPTQVETEELPDEAVSFADHMPIFPGCNDPNMTNDEKRICTESQLMKYIHKNLKYPVMERSYGIEGTVIIQFVVDKEGKLSDIETKRAISKGLDSAAEKVIQKMSKELDLWTPGRMGVKNVKVRYYVPIKFRLE